MNSRNHLFKNHGKRKFISCQKLLSRYKNQLKTDIKPFCRNYRVAVLLEYSCQVLNQRVIFKISKSTIIE